MSVPVMLTTDNTVLVVIDVQDRMLRVIHDGDRLLKNLLKSHCSCKKSLACTCFADKGYKWNIIVPKEVYSKSLFFVSGLQAPDGLLG